MLPLRSIMRTTHFTMWIPPAVIRFQISAPSGSMRYRRFIALMVFRALRREFKQYLEAHIRHAEGYYFPHFDDGRRPFKLRQVTDVSTEKGRRGTWIREKRLSMGMTQKQLALRAGLSPTYVSELEHGRHEIRPTTWQKILLAMSTSKPFPIATVTSGKLALTRSSPLTPDSLP